MMTQHIFTCDADIAKTVHLYETPRIEIIEIEIEGIIAASNSGIGVSGLNDDGYAF